MNRVAVAIVCLLLPCADVFAGVRPLAVSAETGKKMAKYSLAAYENGDPTNRVKALLFTPKPMGMNALPMDGGNGNRNLKGDMVCCVLNAVRAND